MANMANMATDEHTTSYATARLRDFTHGLLFGTAAGFALTVMGLCVAAAAWAVFPSVN